MPVICGYCVGFAVCWLLAFSVFVWMVSCVIVRLSNCFSLLLGMLCGFVECVVLLLFVAFKLVIWVCCFCFVCWLFWFCCFGWLSLMLFSVYNGVVRLRCCWYFCCVMFMYWHCGDVVLYLGICLLVIDWLFVYCSLLLFLLFALVSFGWLLLVSAGFC